MQKELGEEASYTVLHTIAALFGKIPVATERAHW